MNNWQRWRGIQKCYPFEEKRLSTWSTPYIVQPKYDGVRCRAIPLYTGPKGNEYLLVSSEENTIFSVPHLNELFSKLSLRIELDGELYCHGMTFEQIVSITSRTVNLHEDYSKIQFHCFDIIEESMPQLKRSIMLENLRGLSPWLKVAPFHLCNTLDDVTRAYDRIIGEGYEGIIVRHPDAPYERKRSTYVMKFKPKKDDDYEIIGCVEEIDQFGNAKDALGSIICKSGDGTYFNVGTGFTSDDRQRLWGVRQLLPGNFAKVQYQHLTSGKKVPRFPVFVEVIWNKV